MNNISFDRASHTEYFALFPASEADRFASFFPHAKLHHDNERFLVPFTSEAADRLRAFRDGKTADEYTAEAAAKQASELAARREAAIKNAKGANVTLTRRDVTEFSVSVPFGLKDALKDLSVGAKWDAPNKRWLVAATRENAALLTAFAGKSAEKARNSLNVCADRGVHELFAGNDALASAVREAFPGTEGALANVFAIPSAKADELRAFLLSVKHLI